MAGTTRFELAATGGHDDHPVINTNLTFRRADAGGEIAQEATVFPGRGIEIDRDQVLGLDFVDKPGRIVFDVLAPPSGGQREGVAA